MVGELLLLPILRNRNGLVRFDRFNFKLNIRLIIITMQILNCQLFQIRNAEYGMQNLGFCFYHSDHSLIKIMSIGQSNEPHASFSSLVEAVFTMTGLRVL